MSDHPYAGPTTMVPGETADDDPFTEESFCKKCDDYVTPIPETGTCPNCGTEVA